MYMETLESPDHGLIWSTTHPGHDDPLDVQQILNIRSMTGRHVLN